MSTCSATEIAEKKRIALEKLRAKKQQIASSNDANKEIIGNSSSPNVRTTFTRKPSFQMPPPATASEFINSLKQINIVSHRHEVRDKLHPYNRPKSIANNSDHSDNKSIRRPILSLSPTKPVASVYIKSVTCKLYIVSATRFAVESSEYHAQMVDNMKTIPSKAYDPTTQIWTFDISDYKLFQERMAGMKPDVIAGTIPKSVLKLFATPVRESDSTCLASIEPNLAEKLLPFQRDGVCFAIAQKGRIMICDEMGLGKTYQALAVADFYRENWPLLICTTASTRESWASHIRELLPYVPVHYIQVLVNNQQYIGDTRVLVTSYNMMERHSNQLMERKFGFLIFDESHTLKNSKAKCTLVADRLAQRARHVILLSGTPALSRPVELFSQLKMIDRKFMSFMDYTSRYCDGKQTNFGWNASGQSNLQELNILLKMRFMIRRTKADVLPELAVKLRETVVLDPSLVWTNHETEENLSQFAKNFLESKGREKEEILLKFYARTAEVKTKAVCAYLKKMSRENTKFIVFAHHRVMLDAICDCLKDAHVKFIRIDGTTKNDTRAQFIETFQQKSSCRAAVLSLRACNSGITLTAAEMIIFAELDWNPSTLAQAESRAHRIGQLKPVTCRYLMASKTADDIIWNMLKNKQDVLNSAGLFGENLQEAKHVLGPTMSQKIDHYFSPDKMKTTKIEEYFSPSKQQNAIAAEHRRSSEEAAKDDYDEALQIIKELENIDELFKDDDDAVFMDLPF